MKNFITGTKDSSSQCSAGKRDHIILCTNHSLATSESTCGQMCSNNAETVNTSEYLMFRGSTYTPKDVLKALMITASKSGFPSTALPLRSCYNAAAVPIVCQFVH